MTSRARVSHACSAHLPEDEVAAGSVAPGYREAGSDSARPRGGSSLLLAMVGSSGPLSPSRFVWAQTLYSVMTGVNLSETGSPNYTCRHQFMVLISAMREEGCPLAS